MPGKHLLSLYCCLLLILTYRQMMMTAAAGRHRERTMQPLKRAMCLMLEE